MCKLLNAWALKHHLPDLEMNSTVITSSTFGFAHNYTAISSFPFLAKHGNTYLPNTVFVHSGHFCWALCIYFMQRFSSFMQRLPDLAQYQKTKPEVHAIITCMVISWISERFYRSFELASTKAGWWFGLWKIKESLSVMV